MKISALFLTMLLILIGFNTAFSQGDYLKRGANGVGLSATFSSNSDNSILSGKIGYSVSGVFDFGLFGGYYTSADLDLNNIIIGGVSFTYYAIKQKSGKFPLSMSLNLAYHRDSYSGEYLKQLDWEKNGDYFTFGLNLFGNINSTPLITFQPNGSISFIAGSINIRDSYGNFESENNNVISFSFGISMFFETSPNSIFRIDPNISISEDNTTFSIAVGVILLTGKK